MPKPSGVEQQHPWRMGCKSEKIKFSSVEQAKFYQDVRGFNKYGVYRCRECDQYHVTTKEKYVSDRKNKQKPR